MGPMGWVCKIKTPLPILWRPLIFFLTFHIGRGPTATRASWKEFF